MVGPPSLEHWPLLIISLPTLLIFILFLHLKKPLFIRTRNKYGVPMRMKKAAQVLGDKEAPGDNRNRDEDEEAPGPTLPSGFL